MSPPSVGRAEVSFTFEGVRTKNPLLSCSDDNDNVNPNDKQNDREEQKQTDDDIVSRIVPSFVRIDECDFFFKATDIRLIMNCLVIVFSN